MAFKLIFKPLAQLEVSEAFEWYTQPHIVMGEEFLAELEHTSGLLASNRIYTPA